jgi:hypothetical protein
MLVRSFLISIGKVNYVAFLLPRKTNLRLFFKDNSEYAIQLEYLNATNGRVTHRIPVPGNNEECRKLL